MHVQRRRSQPCSAQPEPTSQRTTARLCLTKSGNPQRGKGFRPSEPLQSSQHQPLVIQPLTATHSSSYLF
ncbi:hypothetical protein BC567DRAFT_222926 [Phyllosticta citribraziliensis]